MQLYLYVVLSSYSSEQEKDHIKYNDLKGSSTPETIPMNNRNDWDGRPSSDFAEQGYSHGRQASSASMSDVIHQPVHQPRDGFSDVYSRPAPQRQYSSGSVFQQPLHAYTQDPGPTPRFNASYYPGNETGGIGRPAQAQAHPGESYVGGLQ